MRSVIRIVSDEEISDYADKLMSHLEKQEFETMSCTYNEYKRMPHDPDSTINGEMFIFIGASLQGQPRVPDIQTWQYQKFGCKIGWEGNECVIFAKSNELPFVDYKEFKTYCENKSIDYTDVVIPPETPLVECFNFVKHLIDDEDNSVHNAQYSTLIYEFVDKYFLEFMQSEPDIDKNRLEDEAKKQKSSALHKLTMKQKIACNAIIHAASISSAAVAFVPIPVADVVPITAIQVSMIVGLANVFGNKLTKSDAQVLLKAVAAPLAGRALAKTALIFVPGVGWAINGVLAGTITQVLGWAVVNDFAIKNQK